MPEHQRPAIAVMNTLLTEMVAPLAEAFDLRFPGCETQGQDEAVIAIVGVGTDRISAALMDRYPRLRLIASPSAGVDGVDLAAASARGIGVTSGAGINAPDVAAHAVGLALAARTGLFAGDAFVRSGAWQTSRPQPRRSIAADKVGIVGLGAIGGRVAASLAPLCEAVAWFGPRAKDAPWPRKPSLRYLAVWADILVLCARGGADTRGMIGADEIAAIGPDGLFVNVARGYMVDEQALRAALMTGALGGAALDVFEREPCPPDLWQDVPNCMLSPHRGGSTSRTAELAGELVRANLRALLSGAPLRNQVMPDPAKSTSERCVACGTSGEP
ncbi:NAD(P)-dependent oxidoreductase [Novosphingobium sp. PASSN1]|uniref:NAD(P)-dependent oxidoreductase n=1 Tax=Novosphingobium sp. PASSN1 TaxID=2015561 RepID=UPI0025D428D2|nr:NAD(P)-dependent oxidoreductase [Novosphingobium sp. PASSN1]